MEQLGNRQETDRGSMGQGLEKIFLRVALGNNDFL
jgi:hypothetical protein